MTPGHYWVHIEGARQPWHIAYWTGAHFETFRHPGRFGPDAFTEIGPRIEDQLISIASALEAPHFGSNDTQLDNYFDACDPIRDFVKEANLK